MRGESLRKYFLILCICSACAISTLLLHLEERISADAAVAFFIGIVMLAGVLLDTITAECDGLDISISNLPGLYGFFYALYCLGSLVSYALEFDMPGNNVIEISGLMVLGYFGWRTGMALSCPGEKLHPPAFDYSVSRSLLVLCWIGFGILLVAYVYRAATGAFFTHGARVTQDPTLSGAFIFNMTYPFEYPILILSALLSRGRHFRYSAMISLWVFAGTLMLIHLVAGEFRIIVTGVFLILTTLQFAGGLRLTWGRLLSGAAVCAVMLFMIQVARITALARGGGAMGVRESVSMLVEGVESSPSLVSNSVVANSQDRSSEGAGFLSALIDRVSVGQPYIYGKVMGENLMILIPRALWPEKPSFASPQREIKLSFGLPDGDDVPGPISSYYAFGGPLAVLICLFIFGLFFGSLLRWVARSKTLFPWIVLIWILGALIYVEDDQQTALLVMLRHCLVSYMIFRLVYLLLPSPETYYSRVHDRNATAY